jgi:hypothetical protein
MSLRDLPSRQPNQQIDASNATAIPAATVSALDLSPTSVHMRGRNSLRPVRTLPVAPW